jgi:signal peptidase II
MTENRGGRQWRWALPVAAAIVLTDVITKELVQASFAYGERVAVTNFFNLVFVLNPGAAFSFLANAGGWQKPVLLGLGLIVAIFLVVMLVRNPMHRLTASGLAGVLGGAVGNVIDRARHGAVVDWLDFHLAGWHWPAFNVADIGITVGAAALILDAFIAPKSAPQQAPR